MPEAVSVAAHNLPVFDFAQAVFDLGPHRAVLVVRRSLRLRLINNPETQLARPLRQRERGRSETALRNLVNKNCEVDL